MIAYVESNFVLELALGQEEAPSAQDILELAETNKIQLVYPAFALSEPFSTITYRALERRRLYDSLAIQLGQIQRSQPHHQIASALKAVLSMWLDMGKKETDLLESTVKRLLNVSKPVEMDLLGFEQALAYRDRYSLSLQDAIVYSAVIADLRQRNPKEPKCFISRNSKDFNDPGIKSELKPYSCRYIASFVDGLGFIRSKIA